MARGAESRLRDISDTLWRRGGTPSRVRKSARGVPHLVVNLGPDKASVAYFKNAGVYKVFYPYMAGSPQSVTSCKTMSEVLDTVADRERSHIQRAEMAGLI